MGRWTRYFLKMLAGFLGVLLAFEILLRLTGGALLFLQQYQNKSKIDKGYFLLLCLGDSMTYMGGADAYPQQLETILNSYQSKIKFKIINKAVPGNRSVELLDHLEGQLADYKPDAVLVMIGMNDNRDLNYEKKDKQPWLKYFGKLRVFKLFASLVERTGKKEVEFKKANDQKEVKPELDEKIGKLKIQLERAPFSMGYTQLGFWYWMQKKIEPALNAFRKAVELDASNYMAQGNLAHILFQEGEYEKASEIFALFLKLCPKERTEDRAVAYERMMDCYSYLFNYPQAETVIRQFAAEFPNLFRVYEKWGRLLYLTKNLEGSKQAFLKSLQLNPTSLGSYLALANMLGELGETDQAKRVYQRVIELHPDKMHPYYVYGYFLLDLKKYVEAEQIFKKSLTLGATGYKKEIYTYLIKTLETQGKTDEALKYRSELFNLDMPEKANYNRIKEILAEKKISMIAVQYPRRDVTLLKYMLDPASGVIFVDNKDNFENALKEWNFYDLFIDADGEDFGHFTPRGARIMAQSIAEVVLRYFGQS